MFTTLIRFRKKPAIFACALFSLGCLATGSGCTAMQGIENAFTYNDATNDFVMGWRNSVWARQAWHERKSQFVGEDQFVDFGEGFRAGYEDVAGGGNGCPPGIAPRKYWNWKYQSPEGQAKVAAWFAGYPHGARAAEEDGAGLYQQIQVSGAIERQYCPEFIYGSVVPTEEVPAGTQAPLDAGPPAPSPTDSSATIPTSGLMTRGLAAYRSTSTVSDSGRAEPVSAHFQSNGNWPSVTQVSAVSPIANSGPVSSQTGVQQAWAVAR